MKKPEGGLGPYRKGPTPEQLEEIEAREKARKEARRIMDGLDYIDNWNRWKNINENTFSKRKIESIKEGFVILQSSELDFYSSSGRVNVKFIDALLKEELEHLMCKVTDKVWRQKPKGEENDHRDYNFYSYRFMTKEEFLDYLEGYGKVKK